MSEQDLMSKLWGEHYFDPKLNKIVNKKTPGSVRTFTKFIYQQLYDLYYNIDSAKIPSNGVYSSEQKVYVEKYTKIMNLFNVKLSKDESDFTEKKLFKAVMQSFVPLGESLFEGIRNHLPSPDQAQKYRVTTLYEGPQDDDVARSIKNCDPDGPLVAYVSKTVPSADNSRFYAFCRVFSGTLSIGQKVTVLDSNYIHGKKTDMSVDKTIQSVSIMVGAKMESVGSVKCGNTAAILGIHQYYTKNATVTSVKYEPYAIKMMKLDVSPIVQRSISVKNSKDLPKMSEGIKKLLATDQCVKSFHSENGEIIIAGAGELHLEILLNDLRDFMKGAEIIVSEPIVPFRETVSATSPECLSKSPNKHNRIVIIAEPLSDALMADFDSKTINMNDNGALCRRLVDEHGWEPYETKKIWGFRPLGEESNILVDGTKGVSYLSEVKESIVAAFEMICNKGPLCEGPLRGIKFTIVDITLHADAIHRGMGQIMPMASRCMTAAVLSGAPKLIEPHFRLDINVPDAMVSTVYSCVGHKGGQITGEARREGTMVKMLTGTLPVLSSFGFDAYIRGETSGQAATSCVFSHWAPMSSDPLEEGSKVRKIILHTRKSKGHPCEVDIPPLERFLDKL
jgi:elongation factor 2